jgi:hypothetical protein
MVDPFIPKLTLVPPSVPSAFFPIIIAELLLVSVHTGCIVVQPDGIESIDLKSSKPK